MCSPREKLLLPAGALVVIGVVTVPRNLVRQTPRRAGRPAVFWLLRQRAECKVSVESFNAIGEHESSRQPFRIAGVVIVVLGRGTAAPAPFVGRRSTSSGDASA